jgi:hypothetical protein
MKEHFKAWKWRFSTASSAKLTMYLEIGLELPSKKSGSNSPHLVAILPAFFRHCIHDALSDEFLTVTHTNLGKSLLNRKSDSVLQSFRWACSIGRCF